MTHLKIIPLMLVLAYSVSGCVPVIAVGAGAAVGTFAASEGGIGGSVTDTRIGTYVRDNMLRQDKEAFRKVSVTVFEARVMLVGTVQKAEQRDLAVRLAWKAEGVRQVINEIRIEPAIGIGAYTRDSWISTQLKTRLVSDSDVESLNYRFETHGSNIYLIGVARDQEELNRVINHARSIAYVREVVSYVRLRTDARPDESLPASSYSAQ